MDWTALSVSLRLAFGTCLLLIPFGLWLGRTLASRDFRGKAFCEALVALPLVMPPTVLGFYLMQSFGSDAPFGALWHRLFGDGLNFTFNGILVASLLANLPFAVQPIQRAFESVPGNLREAAWCSGLSPWQTLLRIELPLVWPGIVSAMALTFAHTLGEFGVILMVGGSIDGETRTLAIAIYDRVQAFDEQGAGIMSAMLLALSFMTIGVVYGLAGRRRWRHV
ncbi:molybdate ABC transporter permease subunit [Halomonas urumqiensis]|uniref:Molybdenum transport system permease n=1 Tax=Halomonas urumqiensis TaxID=1684789 RepID=A0A2N7UH68_9GAMM|nr:molybdate ABC transporter permease subunit [Halomonas urumqiensis]PMR79816.1 molybdate ABC transporter permease subunit [Halomonas urumqiensis]PTB02156.1 molybdate ABC transporter permease subunit [Halomonas urumqiensis]GHE21613.1 molybdenum ABC transporter permease subunit [Halomonas urumqiensis]